MCSKTQTQVWGNPSKAKVLVVGHDPRLQRVDTIARYCFFADYYFKPKPAKKSDLKKYQLAESVFTCTRDLTSGRFCDDEILITNLCNEALPPAPVGKTVYIPQDKAEDGLENIRALLKVSKVKLVFAMSQQVNYWLQKLGFYAATPEFLYEAEPKECGVKNEEPYYEPKKPKAFKRICGQKYVADREYFLFPILHVKSYPLTGKFRTYQENYLNCKNRVGETIDLLVC